MKDMYYYDVSPLRLIRSDADRFTYSSTDKLSVGALVMIEVGTKTMPGVVMATASQPSYAVKGILSALPYPPLPMPLLQTAQWMSQYYQSHLSAVWQTLLPRGVEKRRRTPSQKIENAPRINRTKKVFTPDQSRALTAIRHMSPGTLLLHGKTGSGKTAVYIEACRDALQEGKSSIVLVPEIALTSQIVAEFSTHFPDIIVTHSRQTEAERHRAWQSVIHTEKPCVIIGPRSALFMPVARLGTIIIDEAHEPSFKQEQTPRYAAQRVASVLAREHGAKLILGSATPSVTDYYLAAQSNRPIVTMTTPARDSVRSPRTTLVDMTKRDLFTQHFFLSDPLLQAMKKTLDSGKQSLLFHNRRGTASVTLCETCGWSAGCPRCFIPLTLHADRHQLQCHLCATTLCVPTSCPECHAADIIHKGIGTKRLEAEVQKYFPNTKIVRFDADSASDATVDALYEQLHDGAIDIIIGTQVVAKGLDLPHLRTVGVVQADAGLSLPDFSASERTFQLLAQVVGRVGRSHHATDVIVQTYQPDHPAIKDGLTQNYADFYERTLRNYQIGRFPPFRHLLKLTGSYKTETAAIKNATALAKSLKAHAAQDVEILGPMPAFYERQRDNYRWQLIVKSPRRADLITLLPHLPPRYWQHELDPLSLL